MQIEKQDNVYELSWQPNEFAPGTVVYASLEPQVSETMTIAMEIQKEDQKAHYQVTDNKPRFFIRKK